MKHHCGIDDSSRYLACSFETMAAAWACMLAAATLFVVPSRLSVTFPLPMESFLGLDRVSHAGVPSVFRRSEGFRAGLTDSKRSPTLMMVLNGGAASLRLRGGGRSVRTAEAGVGLKGNDSELRLFGLGKVEKERERGEKREVGKDQYKKHRIHKRGRSKTVAEPQKPAGQKKVRRRGGGARGRRVRLRKRLQREEAGEILPPTQISGRGGGKGVIHGMHNVRKGLARASKEGDESAVQALKKRQQVSESALEHWAGSMHECENKVS